MSTKAINTILSLKDNFSSGVTKAANSTKNFERQIKLAQNSIGNMSSITSKLKTGIGLLAGGFGLVKLTEGAIQAGDNVYKLSQRLHLTTAETSSLNKIFTMAGVDSQAFASTITKLDKSVLSAGQSGNSTTKMLEKYGVSLTDTTGKILPMNQQLDALATAYQKAADAGDEEAFSTEVLGQKGASLIPLLENYSEAKEEAAKVKGIGIDPQQAHETAVELKVLKAQVGATAGVMAKSLVPIIQAALPVIVSIIQKITAVIKDNKDKIDSVIKSYMPLFKGIMDDIQDVIEKSFSFIMNHGEQIKTFIIGFGAAFAGINIAAKVISITSGIKKIKNAAQDLSGLSKISKIFETVFKLPPSVLVLVTILATVSAGVYGLWQNNESFRDTVQNKVLPTLSNLVNKFLDLVSTILDSIKPAIEWITTNIVPDNFDSVGNAIAGVLSKATDLINFIIQNWPTIEPIVKGIISAVIAWKLAIIGVNTWIGITTLATSAWSTIELIIWGITNATSVWEATQWALNVALDANPVGVVALAIAGLGIAIYEVVQHWQDIYNWILWVWGILQNNPILMFISTVLNPLGTALLAIVANWDKITSAIQSAYDWFKSWTDKWNNTTLSDKEVNITQNTSYADAPDGDQVSFNPYQHKATGTQYSRGGLTVVGEYGPELIDAQRGSKIYTNSQTNKILSGNSNIPPVYVIIQGNVIGNEEFADSVGQHIYNKLYYQMVNS
jgi:hypothetical protein